MHSDRNPMWSMKHAYRIKLEREKEKKDIFDELNLK